MSRHQWESSYRRARDQLRTPTPLETKILADIRAVKPTQSTGRATNRLLSRAASAFSAIAIAVVLLHPAQYIGAAPGQFVPQGPERSSLEQYRPSPELILSKSDGWHTLRTEVKAGKYVELCTQWRRQQRASVSENLPKDLVEEARKHCRILP